MRAFGSLRIASILAILFLSLATCMPNKKLKDSTMDADYLDDGEYDEDTTSNDDEDDPPARPSGPVIVRSQSEVVEARPGDTVQLPCLVDNADDVVINWMKDKEMIYADTTQVIEYDDRFTRADNFSLIIRNVSEKDASDLWHCQILSQTPATELYHKLHIVEKPRELWTGIHVTPGRHVEVTENDTITLGCLTNNEPKHEIKWSHKGERLHNNNEVKIEGNFVTIKKITMHHAGRYQCLVEDNSENPPTDAIEVVVRYAPRVDVERQVIHTGTGRRSRLTCTVHAHPHAKVTWHKENRKLDNGNNITIVENKPHHRLIIDRTTKEDLGQYTCKAKNKFGESSRMIELTGAPSRPRLHGGEVSDDEHRLILEWQVESFAPIVEYRLEYRRKDEKEWRIVAPRVTDGIGNLFTVEYPLEKLQPGSYEAKLLARNDYGWSQQSDIHTFRQGYKSERAENVRGSASTRQPLLALTALLVVVVTSYESSCL